MMNQERELGHFLARLCADKSGDNFKEVALQFFINYARENATFTTACVRRAYYDSVIGPVAHDDRSWGHITNQAKRAKIIEATGQYSLDGNHGRPNMVWRSLVLE